VAKLASASCCSDYLLNHLIMEGQQPEHPGFVAAHWAAAAHDVGEHDRGQAADLGEPRAGAVFWHEGDYYQAGARWLSNQS